MASYDATRRAPRRLLEEEKTAPAAAPLVLKGAGVALLVIAGASLGGLAFAILGGTARGAPT